jgi:hypothetical protein
VNKGIGCTTCHGPIGQMPLTYRANTLYMRWCIDSQVDSPDRACRESKEVTPVSSHRADAGP